MSTTTEIHIDADSLDRDGIEQAAYDSRDYLLLEAGSRTRTYINRDDSRPRLLVVHDQ